MAGVGVVLILAGGVFSFFFFFERSPADLATLLSTFDSLFFLSRRKARVRRRGKEGRRGFYRETELSMVEEEGRNSEDGF